MRTLRLIFGFLILLFVVNVTIGCKNEADEPELPGSEVLKKLVDKKDSIFLDNGEYVKATTEFTKDQAEVILKSKIWRKAKWLVYETYKIKSFNNNTTFCYKFNDNYKYQYLYDYPTQEKMDKEIAQTKEVNYTIEGKNLKFENVELFDYTIVAVDSNRVVLDRLCNQGDWMNSRDFPQEFDRKTAKVRCVLTPWCPR